jgi:hypothetical protein
MVAGEYNAPIKFGREAANNLNQDLSTIAKSLYIG